MTNKSIPILFVDDEESILNSLARLLRKENYSIHLANSAKKGLEALEKNPIEIVISDQKMSEMDGIEFLHKVKIKFPKSIRIMLTGYADSNTIQAAILKSDVYKFIQKPWDNQEMIDTIRQATLVHQYRVNNQLLEIKEKPSLTFRKIEKLRNLFIQERLVSPDCMKQAIAIREQSSESLVNILLRLNYIQQDKLLDFFSRYLKIPFEKLSSYEIDPEVVSLISEKFARRYKAIPISQKQNTIIIAMCDPIDIITLSDIQALLGKKGNVQPVLCSELEILQVIENHYNKQYEESLENGFDDSEEIPAEDDYLNSIDLDSSDFINEELNLKKEETDIVESQSDASNGMNDASIISLVNSIIAGGVKEKASDIHMGLDQDRMRIRYRIDGILFEKLSKPKEQYLPTISRVKIMASLDISQKWLPQDGRIKVKVCDKDIELRVSTYPTINGESIVLRIFDKTEGLVKIESLGLFQNDITTFKEIIHNNYGIFLVTGPTGSGKTTTLYAALRSLDAKKKNIITVEEPVEFKLNDISQGEIQPKRGLDFANALRAILRHDPDIILVGEIRDKETASIAFRASMTGHLVFSTLHTNSAVGTLSRLIDLGVEPFIIASSIKGILSQRLVRKVCRHCKEKFTPSKFLLQKIGVPHNNRNIQMVRGKGCDKCKGTGYKGRVGLFEFLTVTDEIKYMIADNKPEKEIEQAALNAGMRKLRMDGFSKAVQGVTTLEEIIRMT